MGRAVGFVIFAAFLLFFFVIKFVFFSAKTAYEMVFDPKADDRRIQSIIEQCAIRIHRKFVSEYDGSAAKLRLLIAELTPMIQGHIFDAGYKVPSEVIRNLVCDIIVKMDLATSEEVRLANA